VSKCLRNFEGGEYFLSALHFRQGEGFGIFETGPSISGQSDSRTERSQILDARIYFYKARFISHLAIQ
jgi:hypothetical protein